MTSLVDIDDVANQEFDSIVVGAYQLDVSPSLFFLLMIGRRESSFGLCALSPDLILVDRWSGIDNTFIRGAGFDPCSGARRSSPV